MPVYTNPIIDQDVSPKQLFYVDDKCAIFTCNGSPEGIIQANTGSIAISDNGSVYKKSTDFTNTGWLELIGVNTFGNILNVPRNIQSRNDVVGNVGVGLDSLHSHSLVAASLANDNDFVYCHYSGRLANNANTKRLVLSIDGQISFDSGARQFNIGALSWDAKIEYTRLSATTVSATGFVQMGTLLSTAGVLDAGNSRFYVQAINPAIITVANLLNNAVTLLVQGEATADNDITQNRSRIDLIQK